MNKLTFRQILKRIKDGQINRAANIRNGKHQRKEVPNGYVQGLVDTQHNYRVRHIVYCLMRGKTMAQIESNRANNPPDPSHYPEIYLRKSVAKDWRELTGQELQLEVFWEVHHGATLCISED